MFSYRCLRVSEAVWAVLSRVCLLLGIGGIPSATSIRASYHPGRTPHLSVNASMTANPWAASGDFSLFLLASCTLSASVSCMRYRKVYRRRNPKDNSVTVLSLGPVAATVGSAVGLVARMIGLIIRNYIIVVLPFSVLMLGTAGRYLLLPVLVLWYMTVWKYYAAKRHSGGTA